MGEVRDVERPCVKLAKAAGYTEVKVMKASRRGFPDRLFMKPGHSFWCEMKDDGEEPTEQQLLRHEELRAAGQEVHWVDNVESFRVILK